MSKKQLLANLLNKLFPHGMLSSIRAFLKDELIVLAYHRVCDIKKSQYIYDIELISADSDSFEYQIKYIKKHYNPISMNQLIDYIENKKSLPKKPILITFDDGFDDNYTKAFPILKKYNVPATIFITTSYIGTDKTIWFDHLASLIFLLEKDRLFIKEIGKTYNLSQTKKERGPVMEALCEDLKLIPNTLRESILERLNNEYSSILKNIDNRQSRMLNWEQIKEMSDSIIDIGSHTVTHSILTKLTDEKIYYELSESKEILEKELGVEIASISYPNGNEDAYNETVINNLNKLNYKIAFTYIAGNNPLPIANKLAIKRLHVENYINKNYFNMLLCMPGIFSD